MTTALVLGSADCVWADVEAALDLGEFDGVVGCNHVGIHWPGVMDGWASLHPDKFKPWREGRRRRGLPEHRAHFGIGQVPHRFPGQTNPGSSGLFALKVALDELGFDRAVLCGVPMLGAAGHFNDPVFWRGAAELREGWTQALPAIRDRARSMSGWTARLLGLPDEEFLAR